MDPFTIAEVIPISSSRVYFVHITPATICLRWRHVHHMFKTNCCWHQVFCTRYVWTRMVLWHQEATPRREMTRHGMKTTSRYATGLNPGKMNKPVHGHPNISQLLLQFTE